MFGRSGVIDDSQLRVRTTLGDALQIPGHDPQRIPQQGAVGGMVNVSFYGGGIGAQLLSGNDARLDGLLHDPLVDLLSAFLAKERKSPTEIAKIWNRVLIKAGKASIQKAGAQFPLKLTIRPTFDVLKHNTTQQPIRSNPFAASSVGPWPAGGQDLRA
jgi:hypothetical protein